jgi:hypothetical protein
MFAKKDKDKDKVRDNVKCKDIPILSFARAVEQDRSVIAKQEKNVMFSLMQQKSRKNERKKSRDLSSVPSTLPQSMPAEHELNRMFELFLVCAEFRDVQISKSPVRIVYNIYIYIYILYIYKYENGIHALSRLKQISPRTSAISSEARHDM